MAKTIRPQRTYPISLRRLTVRRAFDVSSGLRRVEFEGSELAGAVREGFDLPPFASDGFDDEIKLFFPDPDSGELSLPVQRDRFIDWPRDPRPEARTYTVRYFDPAAGVLAVDFARHSRGVATTWAETCAPGDDLHIAGPKLAWLHPEGADWLLIGGDDTAIPAIARWLESMPADARGLVFIEVPDAAHEFALTRPDGVLVTWVHRGETPAAASTALIDAVLGAEWLPGEPFCWVAGETGVLRPIRRHLRQERGVLAERVEVTGYWRAPAVDPDSVSASVSASADETSAAGADALDDDHDNLHELSELLPPFALRAAVTLDLVPALRAGHDTVATLAEATSTDAAALARLLRYLGTLGLVEQLDGRWWPTSAGAALDDEDESAGLDLRRPLAAAQLAVTELLDVVRHGGGSGIGGGLASRRATDPDLDAALVAHAADDASYVASSFGTDVPFSEGEHVVASGDGALAVLAGPLAADPTLRVTLLERPSRIGAALATLPPGLRDRIEVLAVTGLDAWPADVGTAVLVNALRELPDADAAHVLTAAVATGARVLVLEEVLGIDEIDDHDAGDDLLWLCLTGVGRRTIDELEGVVARADLTSRRQSIGWGDLLLHVESA